MFIKFLRCWSLLTDIYFSVPRVSEVIFNLFMYILFYSKALSGTPGGQPPGLKPPVDIKKLAKGGLNLGGLRGLIG